MLENNKTEEKSCLFCVSDYHFEMIALPYVKEKIDDNNQVIVMTQDNLEKSMKYLLEQVNLDNENKKKIESINWEEKDIDKIDEINNLDKENNKVVFIKGNNDYIKNVNAKLDKIQNIQNLQIIDCYDVNNVEESIVDITRNYNSILSTSGLKNF